MTKKCIQDSISGLRMPGLAWRTTRAPVPGGEDCPSVAGQCEGAEGISGAQWKAHEFAMLSGSSMCKDEEP